MNKLQWFDVVQCIIRRRRFGNESAKLQFVCAAARSLNVEDGEKNLLIESNAKKNKMYWFLVELWQKWERRGDKTTRKRKIIIIITYKPANTDMKSISTVCGPFTTHAHTQKWCVIDDDDDDDGSNGGGAHITATAMTVSMLCF